MFFSPSAALKPGADALSQQGRCQPVAPSCVGRGSLPHQHLLLLHLRGLRQGHASPLVLLSWLTLAFPGLLVRGFSIPLLLAVGAVSRSLLRGAVSFLLLTGCALVPAEGGCSVAMQHPAGPLQAPPLPLPPAQDRDAGGQGWLRGGGRSPSARTPRSARPQTAGSSCCPQPHSAGDRPASS